MTPVTCMVSVIALKEEEVGKEDDRSRFGIGFYGTQVVETGEQTKHSPGLSE